jgi:hypothetical protein
VYRAGAHYPSATLLPPAFDNVQRIALDKSGNLYAHYFNFMNRKSGIVEWSHATGTAFDLNLPIAAADSLATTKSGATGVRGRMLRIRSWAHRALLREKPNHPRRRSNAQRR